MPILRSHSWKELIPSANAMSSWTAYSRHLAAEATLVPFRPIVGHQCKLRRKNPPLTLKREITALHVCESNVLTF